MAEGLNQSGIQLLVQINMGNNLLMLPGPQLPHAYYDVNKIICI